MGKKNDEKDSKSSGYTPFFQNPIFEIAFKAAIASKNISGTSPIHNVIPDSIMFHLLRYTLNKKPDKASYEFLKNEEPLNCSPKNAPQIDGGCYFPSSIRDGWVYIYNDANSKWYEFKVTNAYETSEVFWRTFKDENYNEREASGKKGIIRLDIKDGKYPILWFAYSEVQWSVKYLRKTLGSEDEREKRMRKFDTDAWVKGANIPDAYSVLDINAFFKKGENNYAKDFDIYNQQYKLAKSENKLANVYLCLDDPIGAAEDLCSTLEHLYEEFKIYLEKLVSGGKESTDAAIKNMNELYSLTISLYHTIYSEKKWEDKFGTKLSKDRITLLLANKERANYRKKIYTIQDILGSLITSDYYQKTLDDYTDNIDVRILNGKKCMLKHFKDLICHANDLDKSLTLKKDYEEEKYIRSKKKWLKIIIEEPSKLKSTMRL